MKTILLESTDIYNSSEIINFPTNDIHIVCPAIKKGSICSHILFNNCNMDIAEIGKLCDLVNYNKETGCLYPKYRLTLIPKYEAIKDPNLDSALKKIMDDIIKSNEDYLKADKILFIVDDMDWPNQNILKDWFDKTLMEKKDFKYLKEAFFYSLV
jgi:hypothetical protein